MGRKGLWLVHHDTDTVRVVRSFCAVRTELTHSLVF